MKKSLFLAVVLSLILFAGVALASVSFKSENLIKIYSGGEIIRGSVNLSFTNEPAKNLVKSNFEGNITILDLLEENGFSKNEDFNCNTPNCLDGYIKGNEITSLNLNSEEIIALYVQGNIFDEFEEVRFYVQSNSVPSCEPPLEIDFLNDNNNLISSKFYVDETCFTTKRGCYESDLNPGEYQKAVIPTGNGKYCERISLPAGPAYKLGATVDKTSSGNANLRMSLLSLEGNTLGSCLLPNVTQSTQTVECITEYSSAVQKEYYVCINAEASSNYKINVEFNNPCGTNSPGQGQETIDYDVFAKNLKFNSPRIMINSSNFESSSGIGFYSYLEDYIHENYNGICSSGCVIPIKLTGVNQAISLSDISVRYKAAGAGGLENNKIYEANVEPAKLSSNELQIDIEKAEFRIPFGSEKNKLELFIDDGRILSVPINISGGFEFDVNPKFVAFGQETTFISNASRNITESKWIFGDGNRKNSNGNSVIHRYTEQGEFDMEVQLKDSTGKSSKKNFTIIVGDPKTSANNTLEIYRKSIEDTKRDLLSYPDWIRVKLEEELEIREIDGVVAGLQARYNQASTDSEYADIMLDLVRLEIPKSVSSPVRGKLPLILGVEEIDVRYIEQISGTNVDNKGDLRLKIGSWMTENFDSEIEFEKVYANYNNKEKIILSYFKINLNPKSGLGNAYLIIDYARDQIKFDREYSQQDALGATFISLSNSMRTISFAINAEVDVEDLRSYISPEVGNLGNYVPVLACDFDRRCEKDRGENVENCPTDCRPYGTAVVLILIVVLAGIIGYIGMKIWYEKNYERKLFRKKLDLYNLVNFVKAGKSNGMSRSEMKNKLRKSGWNGEQIAYALKKTKYQQDSAKSNEKPKR